MITSGGIAPPVRRFDAAWAALTLSALLVLISGFLTGRAMVRSVVILSEPDVSYADEVGKVVTSKLYLPLALVLLALIAVGAGVIYRRLRISAAAVALLLAIPSIFMASSALDFGEKLLREPYELQLRVAESFPASSDWTTRSSGGRAGQFPEAKVVWQSSSGVKETCNEARERMNGWADEIRDSAAINQDKNCKFVATKGSDKVELETFSLEEATIVSTKVTSTVPVRIEQFL